MMAYYHHPHYSSQTSQRQLRTSNLVQQSAKSCLPPLQILVNPKTIASRSTHRRNITSLQTKPQLAGSATNIHRTCSKNISEQIQRFRSVALAQCVQVIMSTRRANVWRKLWSRSMILITLGGRTLMVKNERVKVRQAEVGDWVTTLTNCLYFANQFLAGMKSAEHNRVERAHFR